MLERFKGRELHTGQIVQAYFNLHRKCWSLRDPYTKLVLAHTDDILVLGNVNFTVNEAGRRRVLRDKQKNVHAFAFGYFCYVMDAQMMVLPETFTKVTYNPFKAGTFTDALTNERIEDTMFFDRAYLIGKEVFATRRV